MQKEFVKLPVNDIHPYPNNPRINDEAVAYVVESMNQTGNLDPIEVDENNVILSGHTRLLALEQLGITETECVRYIGLTEEQKKKYRLLANQTQQIALWDFEKLREELDNLDFGDFDFGFDHDLDDLYEDEKEIEEDEIPEKAETRCKLGDLWQLGSHRLICGDSTDIAVIDRLMDGVKADCVFTDPPYALVGNSTGLGSATDDMLKPFFLAIFQNICKFTHDLMHVYVCCDWKSCNAILTEAKKTKLTEKSLIVWDKESIGLGSPYMSQYELIWFFENHKQKTMQAGKTEYKNRRNIKGKSNVWKYKRVQDREHNAQKPVELVAEALNNSCFENEVVLDLFGGSGSTLIACEQLNRKCYMAEISPEYCDVIIQRWENFTGQKAVLIDG